MIFLRLCLCLVGRQDEVEHFELAVVVLGEGEAFYLFPESVSEIV